MPIMHKWGQMTYSLAFAQTNRCLDVNSEKCRPNQGNERVDGAQLGQTTKGQSRGIRRNHDGYCAGGNRFSVLCSSETRDSHFTIWNGLKSMDWLGQYTGQTSIELCDFGRAASGKDTKPPLSCLGFILAQTKAQQARNTSF